jgi:hypothetical protein
MTGADKIRFKRVVSMASCAGLRDSNVSRTRRQTTGWQHLIRTPGTVITAQVMRASLHGLIKGVRNLIFRIPLSLYLPPRIIIQFIFHYTFKPIFLNAPFIFFRLFSFSPDHLSRPPAALRVLLFYS